MAEISSGFALLPMVSSLSGANSHSKNGPVSQEQVMIAARYSRMDRAHWQCFAGPRHDLPLWLIFFVIAMSVTAAAFARANFL